jgi:hypothetical protein
LPARQREILTRFYLNEETGEDICRDMGLTKTQFRLAKSRAKMRLTEMGDELQRGRWLRSYATTLPANSCLDWGGNQRVAESIEVQAGHP